MNRKTRPGVTGAFLLLLSVSALAAAPKTTKAVFAVNGLHCAACVETLEASLNELEGVERVKVDFRTKTAVVEFDEDRVAASEVAQAMAATPHMMGRDMEYGGALLLRASRMRARQDATAVQSALSKVRGVSKVTPELRSQSVAVEFADQGRTTTTDLVDAAERAGYTLTPLGSASGVVKGRSGGDGCGGCCSH